jgi:hypothetical protein
MLPQKGFTLHNSQISSLVVTKKAKSKGTKRRSVPVSEEESQPNTSQFQERSGGDKRAVRVRKSDEFH